MTDAKTLAHFEALYPANTRENEISQVVTHIKNGTSSQVVGLPGTGRSTILSLLAYNKEVREKHFQENAKWVHSVYMDFSEVKERNLLDVIKFILISLSYSLSERKMMEEHDMINSILKEGLEFNDDMVLFQALKKSIDYLAIEKELSIVFLFDRFDQYIPHITSEFFSHLKTLRNRAKYRFSTVFSLNRPLQELVEPTIFGEFYEFLIEHIVYVSLYDPHGTVFRLSYIEKLSGKTLPEKEKKQILTLTAGHGKLMRMSFEALLAEDTPPKDTQSFLLQKTNIQGALYELWNSLLPEEQEQIKNNDIKSEDNYLLKSGLIVKGEIAIPLFSLFVLSLPENTQSDELVYDTERNEIYKGKVALSEVLSPSEFRLLRYLVQNNDKVCEKEEIINAIWKDSATLEGVTDQALDQIVYRLRKKIETDPNHPTHIHTIKGRGYKYT